MKLDSTNFYDSVSQGECLVKFYANWCGPCKAYAPTFEEFSKENSDVKCFSVDCETAPEITDDFDVKSIPVTIFFVNGAEISRKPGKLTKEQLSSMISNKLPEEDF
jgi:thioredoxin 1